MNIKSAKLACAVVAAAFVGSLGLQGSAAAAEPASSRMVAVHHCIDVPDRADVRRVQCLLNAAIDPATFPPIPVDGVFGPATAAKLRLFQTCANARGSDLPVDGRIGLKTLAALEFWAASDEYVC